MDRQEKMEILAQSLQKAKKVMQEVEHRSGNKNFGNQPNKHQSYTEQDADNMLVDSTKYLSEAEMIRRQPQQIAQPNYDLYSDNERELPIGQPQNSQSKYLPFKNLKNSKMPKEILESFIETPAIDPTKSLGTETLFEKVKANQPQQRKLPEQIYEQKVQPSPINESKNNGMDIQLLEFVIKKTVEETLKQVQEQSNINENIEIKIGGKTFGGKISTLKKMK